MKRFLGSLALAIIILGCGWALWNKDKINSPESAFELVKNQLMEGASQPEVQWSDDTDAQLASWPQQLNETIRIASFNVQVFGQKKSSNPIVMQRLADICRQFDMIAIQEIKSVDQSVLPNFIRMLNSQGGQYGFVISPRLGRSKSKEQSAFVFNQNRIRMDNSFSYTINDPDDVLRREPFVGWFRTRGPRMEDAFTFTLANVHLDSKRPDLELAYLNELHRIIRKDGRGEDDVILLGDFNCGDRGLKNAREKGGLTWVLSNTPTNTRNTVQYDNIVFDPKATDEFTGNSGVFHFMKYLNLTLDDALAISDHNPIWAEFSIYESGRPRRVADEIYRELNIR